MMYHVTPFVWSHQGNRNRNPKACSETVFKQPAPHRCVGARFLGEVSSYRYYWLLENQFQDGKMTASTIWLCSPA